MDWFSVVSKKHNEYLKIVRSFPENTKNKYTEDIVQDAYIELSQLGTKKHKPNDKRINEKYKDLPICERVLNADGEVNMVYMWITLKRVSMNHLKQRCKTKEKVIRLGEDFDIAAIDGSENVRAYNILLQKVEDELNEWHWYDKLLFEIYLKEGRSMRILSNETGISLTSVFNTLKNCKLRLKEKVGEDFIDFLNKDYELIK
ncbi:MAG: hypothetical protein Unbinned3907contig1000_39 [Prokaryotic dsDNA virus sp.]|nr:MAG: hypothetical protein Unbinned3907contig1000_39 [Prokaryotic dsDNA virus sp.]|tara:strand:- start:4383 stop:4988 length:606 start_codon:yes stop_codon:yes gene_type:complete